jgi:DNA-binding GntR family transcriptional regulator
MAIAPSSRLRWRKLADEVVATLRRMILVGELTPGARTTQDELARLLGVSTMPVREALLRLAAEGFVEASPSRSFTIVRTTQEDVRDIYWMHATLAGELTSRACVNADPELLGILRVLHERGREAQHSGDTAAAETANWAFHREINRAARAPKLSLMLRGSLRFIPEGFYGLLPEWSTASEEGHDQIITALESGDPEAARVAAQAHVHEAGALLASYFSHSGHWTRPSSDGLRDKAAGAAIDATDGDNHG